MDEMLKGKPHFPLGIQKKQYEYLSEPTETEVLIVGGGTTGALALWNFSKRGIPCVLVDEGRFGMRSTAITTALLEYELEENYADLMKQMPEESVKQAYELGSDALKDLAAMIAELGNHCDYRPLDSVLMTKDSKDVADLEKEFKYRQAMGYATDFYTAEQSPYPFVSKAGVISRGGAAILNPYKFSHQLLEQSITNGARAFENTKLTHVHYDDDGVTAHCQYGCTIRCKKIIVSAGYDLSSFTQRQFCTKNVTYNILTKPIPELELNAVVRDSLTQYHYFRLTQDHRLLLGGEDIPYTGTLPDETSAKKKYDKLMHFLGLLFPDYQDRLELDYAACGVFGVTPDNLGVVGSDPDHPRLQYCLGYGANGILFALRGAQMLAHQHVTGTMPPALTLLNPGRAALAGL